MKLNTILSKLMSLKDNNNNNNESNRMFMEEFTLDKLVPKMGKYYDDILNHFYFNKNDKREVKTSILNYLSHVNQAKQMVCQYIINQIKSNQYIIHILYLGIFINTKQ